MTVSNVKGLKIQTGCALNEWRLKKRKREREEKDGRKEGRKGIVVVDELTFFSTSFRV